MNFEDQKIQPNDYLKITQFISKPLKLFSLTLSLYNCLEEKNEKNEQTVGNLIEMTKSIENHTELTHL